ncbi:MAG TPA: DUF2085 domain-containing protein [Pyrinomonadaceae bacterium]|jgi:uncharacterized membrane protein
MPAAIENYTPQTLLPRLKKQARTVWGVSFIVVFVWVSLILLAPLVASGYSNDISAPIYKFFSFFCHQQPERSFHLAEHPFAVCSRCFGVYFGLFAGFLAYPLFRRLEDVEPLSRAWLFLAMIPIGIDWTLGVSGVWTNTHFSRFLTGAILGAACGIYIVPALIEIFRLMFNKTKFQTK